MKAHCLLLSILLTLLSCSSKKRVASIEYTPFSKATIELQVRDKPSDTVYTEVGATTNVPYDRSTSELKIGTNGTYYLDLEIDRPVLSRLSINDSLFNIISIPNDTIRILVTWPKGKIELQFDGSGRAINEYLLAKKKALGYHDLRLPYNIITSRTKYNQILFKTDSLVKNELDFLESYLTNRSLPDWFIQYERAEIEYFGAGLKVAMPGINELFTMFEDTLPSNYYDFLSSVKINNENAILSTRYYMFLDEFFGRGLGKDIDQFAGYARSRKIYDYIHDKAKNRLSSRIALIYNQIMFSKIAQRTSDSLKIDSLAKEFGIVDVNKFKKLIGREAKGNGKFKNLQTGNQVIEFFVTNEIDSLVSVRDFYNKIIYINFWTTSCRPCLANIPELNKVIAEYSDNNRIVFLNICLASKKDNWKKIIKKMKLKGINLIAEGNWGEKLEFEFNIKSFPRYVLLSKENRLFERDTDKAPRIKSKIDKLLETSALPASRQDIRGKKITLGD